MVWTYFDGLQTWAMTQSRCNEGSQGRKRFIEKLYRGWIVVSFEYLLNLVEWDPNSFPSST